MRAARHHPDEAVRRRWPGRITAVLFAGLLLALVEYGLRLVGFGGFPPVVAELGEVDGRLLVEVQPEGTQSYFFGAVPGRGSARTSTFYEPKRAGTIRILLAGESAVLGFPQPRPLSAASFLEWGLERAWPGRDVEIINLGTTAVPSFPVYDMVRQLLPYRPDLVILYAGNNEFYGSYGVCSTHYAGRYPALMPLVRRIQGLALAQALERLVARLNRGSVREEILMERMMAKRTVAADSPLRARAAAHLAHHVRAIAALCAAENIPLMVCSLASNEKDLAPFGSDPAADAADPALAAFRQGTALLEAGETAGAASAFAAAVDADPMPWRPTSLQQEALRATAMDAGAMFCDVRGLFRRLSPGGVIGWELMDDHVHFSLPGQYAFALAVMQALNGAPGRLAVKESALRELPNWEAAAKRLGANPYESYSCMFALREIFSTGFMKTSNPEAAGLMDDRMEAAARAMDPAVASAFVAAVQARGKSSAEFRSASGTAAELLIEAGKIEAAVPLLDFACRASAEYSRTRRINAAMMYACLARLGRLDDDARAGAQAEIARGRVLLAYGADPSGITEFALSKLYELLGQPVEALSFRERALAKNPELDRRWPRELSSPASSRSTR